MHYQQLFAKGSYVLSECSPWLFKLRLVGSAALIFLILLVITRSFIVFSCRYTGNDYRVNTMMDVVVARLFLVFVLYSPHLAVFCRCRTFYYSNICLGTVVLAMEKRL